MASELNTLLRMHDFHIETKALGRVLCGSVSHKNRLKLQDTLKTPYLKGLSFTRHVLSLIDKKTISGASQENSQTLEGVFTDEEISLVTNDELEAFAQEFIAHNGWLLHSNTGKERQVRINEEGKKVVTYLPEAIDLPQEAGESSANYLVRVYRQYVTEQSKRQKMLLGTASDKATQQQTHDHFAKTIRHLTETPIMAGLDKSSTHCFDYLRGIEPFRDMNNYSAVCSANEAIAERFEREKKLLGGVAKHLEDANRQYEEMHLKLSRDHTPGIHPFGDMKSCLEMYSSAESFAKSINWGQDLIDVANRHRQYEGITQSAMLAMDIYLHENTIREAVRCIIPQKEIMPESMATWLENQQQHACDLLKSHETMFRIPQSSEMTRLLDTFQIGSVTDLATHNTKDLIDWQRTLDAISTPWLNKLDSARSISAVLELQSIGKALNTSMGFDPKFIGALRQDLGDWREKIVFPESIFFDPAARTDFYVSRGFNPALTDFPEAAFGQCLGIAGLDGESVDIELDTTPAPLSTCTEEIGLQRNGKCYKLLSRFERQLRQFINVQMTAQYGPNWPKHRLPPETYQKWVDKQQKDENGEHLLLIEFADFNDYRPIICRTDQWREIFEPRFKRKESVQESFQRLHPIRIAVMHSRIVTNDDILFLIAETKRLSIAIK